MADQFYKTTLNKMCQKLGELDMEYLRFLTDSPSMETGADLVKLLLDQLKIHPEDNTFLKDLLENVERSDLVEAYFRGDPPVLVDNVDKEGPAMNSVAGGGPCQSDTSSEIADSGLPDGVKKLFIDINNTSDDVDHDAVLPHLEMKFDPRPYQRSLAKTALKGINSIIALKTGGGKTHTAAYVAKFHSVRAQILRKKFKGVFIVPIRTLGQQQKKVLEEAFPPVQFGPSKVGICQETSEFKECFKKSEMVVCTAQVLINALKKKDIAIQDISLLILDECHHTDKKHPYSRIMKMYRRIKYEGRAEAAVDIYKSNGTILPQILGLSASLGAGSKSVNLLEATLHATNRLNKMCQNIDAPDVVFPDDEILRNLELSNPDLAEDVVQEVEGRSNGQFREKLIQIAEAIAETSGTLELANLRTPCLNYEHLIMQMVEAEKEAAGNDSEMQMAAKYVELIVRAMQFLEIMRAKDVMRLLQWHLENRPDSQWILVSLDATFESSVKNRFIELWSENNAQLEEIASKEQLKEVPIMEQLQNLLIEKFTEPGARGILLSKTRFSTEALKNFIQSSPALSELTIKPERLVGHVEMTDEQDRVVIEDFRAGKFNLLIATDIAQEGLDIPECNFVIRYQFVSNEIGDVQAKGRARMPNAKRYSLIIRGSLEARLEVKNSVLVKAMKNALGVYKDKDKEKWESDVEKNQEKSYWEEKKEEEAARLGKDDPSDYNLVCKKCSQVLVAAKDMVKFNHHHIVSNREDYEGVIKTVAIPPEDQLSFATETYISHVYCVKCGSCVGKEIFVKVHCEVNGYQVILSKDGIRWEKIGEGIETGKKFQWNKVPFWIRDIDEEEEEEQDRDADRRDVRQFYADKGEIDAATFFDDFE